MSGADNETLAEALEEAARRWPERPALTDRHRRLTHAELADAVARLAAGYARLGLAGGARVVSCVSNRCEALIALGAAWRYGAVHVGAEDRSTGPELAAIVEQTGAALLLYEPVPGSADPLAPMETVRRIHPDLHVVIVGDVPVHEEWTRWSELVDSGAEPFAKAAPSMRDPAIVFVSSGTTGRPKATVGFHGNLARRWRRLGGWLEFSPEDVHLAQLPLSHGFGMMMAVAGLLSGGRLVLHERFSAEAALAAVGDEGITVVNGAPAHFKLLLNRLDEARHDVGTLRLSVGTAAPFAPELVTDIWERLGVRFMFMYGSSEGVGVATTDEDDIMRGSVGRPAPGSTAIVGPDHRPLPVGAVGEVAFSRGVYPVRYWEDHDALRPPEPEPVANGDWYYSGDLGRLDEEGRLYIVGRLKHQIDRGGLKVDPMEVENALLTRPEVADAAVLGLLNPVLGEEVCACVAPSPGEAPTLAELRDALGERLAPHKLPEVLYLLDEIPRTRIGKVDSDRLRDLMDARRPQRLVRR